MIDDPPRAQLHFVFSDSKGGGIGKFLQEPLCDRCAHNRMFEERACGPIHCKIGKFSQPHTRHRIAHFLRCRAINTRMRKKFLKIFVCDVRDALFRETKAYVCHNKPAPTFVFPDTVAITKCTRSEEHTSE